MNFKSLLILFVLSLSSLTTINAQEKESGRAVIKTKINCDHFKGCETGELNFKANMLKIKGVKMYTLDENSMSILVYYNPKKTNLETIRTAISKIGYDADDVKADPAGYEKLDSCCKAA